MILMVVVLPAAFGPRKAKNSPLRTVRLRSFTATKSPNFFTRWISSIMRPHALHIQDGLVCQSDTVGQFDTQNFSHAADKNSDFIFVKHPRLQAINSHIGASDLQPVMKRL